MSKQYWMRYKYSLLILNLVIAAIHSNLNCTPFPNMILGFGFFILGSVMEKIS